MIQLRVQNQELIKYLDDTQDLIICVKQKSINNRELRDYFKFLHFLYKR